MGTGRSAAANVVALASKFFRDVSISGHCAILLAPTLKTLGWADCTVGAVA